MSHPQGPERAIRLRDNKRRHRQRQREYVADLERELGETRKRGVQATKEVQAAAQRVVWENQRLRQILNGQGLDNDAIDSLIYKDARTNSGVASLSTKPSRATRTGGDVIKKSDTITATIEYISTTSSGDSPAKANAQRLSSPQRPTDDEKSTHNVEPVPPCKLLTVLADNPNADITQLPGAADDQNECEETDGVECLRAREMLMRFATTEGKIDDIACALEEGCVKNGSGRGCRVKNDVIWKTLDRVCD